MKIHAEEIRKPGFNDLPIDEVKNMVGFIVPDHTEGLGKLIWTVTMSDGCKFDCETQEGAVIMAGIEEIKAKLFRTQNEKM